MASRFHSSIRTLQYAIRGLQLCCAAIILAIYSYILAALSNRSIATPTGARAVEGIVGAAALYVVVICILLRWVVGVPATSFLTLLFDFAFMSCFVYVAVANRGGAGSCAGRVDTPFGSGEGNDFPKAGGDGFVQLPKLGQACRLLSACLAVSIFLIFFFIASILVEIRLARLRHRQKRFGPDGLPPSKTEGGLSIFSRMRWFHMYADPAGDSRPTSHAEPDGEDAQAPMGTVADAHDDGAYGISPVGPPGPLVSRHDSSSSSLRRAQPAAIAQPSQHPAHMYEPAYARRHDHPSQQSVAAYFPPEPPHRSGSWQAATAPYGREPPITGHYYHPPPGQQRTESYPPALPRAGSFPAAQADPASRPLQRMESMPLSIARADPIPQAAQAATNRANTDLSAHPSALLQWTPSFPRENRAPHDPGSRGAYGPLQQQQQQPSPPRGVRPPYPDDDDSGRIPGPPSRPDVPYPDDHSERVAFPDEHARGRGQGNGRYPNYDYESSIYGR